MDNASTLLLQEKNEEQALLRQVVAACTTLQGLLYFRNTSTEEMLRFRDSLMQPGGLNPGRNEDSRNKLIGAILQSKGYILSDPALLNSSRKGALDMDIRRTPNIPWTFCEAVNLRSGSGISKMLLTYLRKTLDFAVKYAFPFYFFIGYMDTSAENFPKNFGDILACLRDSPPEGYMLESMTILDLPAETSGHLLKALECNYDCGGFPAKLYLIFVPLEDTRARQ